MILYVIRHGETEWNHVRRLQGQTDISLNENGISLARQVGEALRQVPFAALISSPLKRALQTGILALGGREIPVLTDSRIKEISFGIFEGYSTVNPDYPSPDPDFHYFFDDPSRYRPPEGGETIAQLFARTGEFLDELPGKGWKQDDRLLVSTHGAAYRALLGNIEQRQPSQLWIEGVPKNCAVSVVQWNGTEWRILEKDRMFV